MVGLNARLGQLSRLELAENRIKSTVGFAKLYSLQHLNLVSGTYSACSSYGIVCLPTYYIL